MAGNWKMNHTHLEAIQVVQKLSYRLEQVDYDACDVVVCPAFTALRSVQTTIDSDRLPIGLGAQDCYWEPSGAFTGEVSAPMLAKLNVGFVIVGHSERRQLFGETDAALAEKVPAALAAGLVPILCVGETEAERDGGETEAVLARQLAADLGSVAPPGLAELVVAYEPIWAIGTGLNATPQQAQEAIAFIRERLREIDSAAAGEVRILYGGSVKPANAAELLAQADLDGALVGGASLDPDDFMAIARAAAP